MSNENNQLNLSKYKKSRFLTIIEATLEYFVSITVGGIYLARITNDIGINDSLTGILSSFVSLGCCFQIVAIFLSKKKNVKSWTSIISISAELFFACIYLVPLFRFSKTAKTISFIILLLLAQILLNVAASPKFNWHMNLVENNQRGSYTAKKEMTSLISGMLFSYFMGTIMDYYKEQGEMRTAFIIGACTIFTLMILHAITLMLIKEREQENDEEISAKIQLKNLVKDKNLLKIILLAVAWSICLYSTSSFMATYQLKELQFSATVSVVIGILSSILRIVFSLPMGKMADKYSFKRMLLVCFCIEIFAYGVCIFVAPNTRWLYVGYSCVHAIGMAGINGGLGNLIYDYIEPNKRASALALQRTFAGVSGFLITLIMSPLVALIQSNNNMFLGLNLYAQQVMAIFSCIISVLIVMYIVFVIFKLKKN